jgi:mono/diheme cytochrome c family protein
MRTATILGVALLALAFGCKQPETVSTTSSSETTSIVTKTATTTTSVTAPVTDTSAATGTVTRATVSTAAPVETSTTATTATSSKATRAAEKSELAKKASGQPVTEGVAGTVPAKNLPPPPKSPTPASEVTSTAPVDAKPTAHATSSSASLVSTGQGIFKNQCVACHGTDASGNTPIGKKNNIPDYRSTAVQGLSDAELANVIANGKGPVSASAHKSKHLTTDQINAVIAFIRSLKS